MKHISIIDYGMGNLSSVKNVLDHLGQSSEIISRPDEVLKASAIIVPGVGAFGRAMSHLKERGLIESLNKRVKVDKVPFLGICLGMQLLADDSEELGTHQGLGWVKGNVVKLQVSDELRLPHVGWNDIKVKADCPLFEGLGPDFNFYFVHNFHFQCSGDVVAATCDYGPRFTAAIHCDNIFAVQFHPEKSQENGMIVMKNFMRIVG